MAKLDAALAWAARGFRVFPIAPNTRGGPGNFPTGAGWVDHATSDESTLRIWFTNQDWNIGVLTNDLVVIDIDVKAGKPGIHTFFDLGLNFDTLTVRTGTGGYHVYYLAPADRRIGQSPIGPGCDVRAWHGYVLAPGSVVEGRVYTIEIDRALSPVPPALLPLLRDAQERRQAAQTLAADMDTPQAIAHARHYLATQAPLAIEGMNGDNTTYRVACKIRDFGVSPEVAFDLMVELWNGRCLPPWSADELQTKIDNAYSYATGPVGSANPLQLYGGVVVPPPIFDKIPGGIFRTGRVKTQLEIPKRPWVMSTLLMRRVITALVATGGVGKSTLILTIAAHLALGQDFLGFKCCGAHKSIVYNAEDDMDELSRRMTAICMAYRLDLQAVNARVILLTADDINLRLTEGANPPRMNEAHVGALLDALMDPEIALFSADPLVEIHSARENDNAEMSLVMAILRMIAQRANVAGLIGHHTKKPALTGASYAGDADASRGAGAVINPARMALTLAPASNADCERFGINDADRHKYIRLDDAKMNMTLLRGHMGWLERRGVQLFNGDEVGTLVPVDMRENIEGVARQMAQIFLDEMVVKGTASMPLSSAVHILMNNDPLHAQLPVTTVRSRIERFIGKGVELLGGHKIGILREQKGPRVVVSVVLT